MYIENNNRLKKLIEYIEENLTNEINYKKLSQILLVNEYTLHRIFYFVTGISLADYIRKRRLSQAAIDLLENNSKIIDIAIKYQYDSSTSFSRAFKNMMGFTPKEIYKNEVSIKYFPLLNIDNISDKVKEIEFEKIENYSLKVYTICKETNMENLSKTAQDFWKEVKIMNILPLEHSYSIAEYSKEDNVPTDKAKYYIGCEKEFKGSKEYIIKNKDFLVFQINSIDGDIIHNFTLNVYANIIPNLGYNLDDAPDIEEYLENDITKLYIPIIR